MSATPTPSEIDSQHSELLSPLSFAEIDAQHVELLPARAVMSNITHTGILDGVLNNLDLIDHLELLG